MVFASALLAAELLGCESPSLDDAGVSEADAGREDGGPVMMMMDAGSIPRPDAGGRDAGPATPDAGNPPLPDAGPPTCSTPDTWYRDLDGDTHGDASATVESCDPVSGFVLLGDDCNDGCAACHPGASEVCDSLDNDCDGERDETQICLPGSVVACTTSCGTSGVGSCTNVCQLPTGSACVPPSEVCNGMDEDCDGAADDGFACASGGATLCTTTCGSTGTGTCSLSCNLPSAGACTPPAEACNGVDDDCDGTRDEGFTCRVGDSVSCTTTCGTTGVGTCTAACGIPAAAACTPPSEVCNGGDDDCDGNPDDGFACTRSQPTACTTVCGSTGTGTCSTSCGLPVPSSCSPPVEACNYADDDCDGTTDEGVVDVGPPQDIVLTQELDMPHVAANATGTIAILRVGTQNHLFRLNRDGTVLSTFPIEGTAQFDLEASQTGFVYAFVESSGEIRVRRLQSEPTAANPYLWSQTVGDDAGEVHLAVGGSQVFVWRRRQIASVRYPGFTTLNAGTGGVHTTWTQLLAHSPTGPMAVGSNGLRRHSVVVATPSGFTFGEYMDNALQDGVPVGTRAVHTLAIAGDYTGDARNGLLIAYGISGPDQIRYHSYRSSTTVFDQSLGSYPLAPSGVGLDLRMVGPLPYLGILYANPSALANSLPRVLQLRPLAGGEYAVRDTGLPDSYHAFAGISVYVLPPVAGLYQVRVLYDRAAGGGFTSRPIGCF